MRFNSNQLVTPIHNFNSHPLLLSRYWNTVVTFPSLNAKVQLDVLDDFESEAKEVTSLNPWLTYGAPLHRAREIGVRRSILGLLDRRRLTKLELMDFLRLLFRHELEELGGGVGGYVCEPCAKRAVT